MIPINGELGGVGGGGGGGKRRGKEVEVEEEEEEEEKDKQDTSRNKRSVQLLTVVTVPSSQSKHWTYKKLCKN